MLWMSNLLLELRQPLKGELGEFWRYRVGDYRILCEIRDV